jgi:hypothetical protein
VTNVDANVTQLNARPILTTRLAGIRQSLVRDSRAIPKHVIVVLMVMLRE